MAFGVLADSDLGQPGSSIPFQAMVITPLIIAVLLVPVFLLAEAKVSGIEFIRRNC